MKNAKKRILFIVTQAEWGGAQNFVFKAATEALRRGHEVLVCAGGEGILEARCTEAGISYRKLQKLKRTIKPIVDIQATAELISLIRSWKPDVVFLFSAKAGIVGAIAARLAGVKRVVYRIGGWSFLDPVSDLQKKIRMFSEWIVAPLKDIIIVQHPGDKALAERCHIRPRKEIVVISNGVNTETFDRATHPREEAKRKLEAGIDAVGQPLVVTIANFYATKNLETLLQAADIVHRARPDIRFVVIGDGGDEKEKIIELRKTLHLENIVSFPGALPNAQTLLSGADLFVLSSVKEGNPWALHEAMATGLPCISTDVGACAWLLQNDAGWIVPPKTPEAMAERILYAIEHPEEARKRAAQARRNIETLFTEQRMWEQTFKTLEE
jgi:glycosyltransferase involved in cell wall biosynthesis